jgi:hypothetical protein
MNDVWWSLALSSDDFTVSSTLSPEPGTNLAVDQPRSGVMLCAQRQRDVPRHHRSHTNHNAAVTPTHFDPLPALTPAHSDTGHSRQL